MPEGKFRAIANQIGMIVSAVAFATFFLWVSGYDALAIAKGLAAGVTSDIAGTVRWATPLILGGLAVCVAFKAEVFNLGVDGQLCMGAAAAAAAALYFPAHGRLALCSAVVLCAMAAGAAYAMVPALLKVFWNTNEVVSTLLLNFIASLFVEYLVTGPMKDTSVGVNLNASAIIPENAFLPRLPYLQPSAANVGFYIALAAAAVMACCFYKTTLGFEIKIVGANESLANCGGIRAKKTTVQVMAISGAISGLIGAIEVAAIQHRLMAGFNPGFGFDGIVVSLLAKNDPIGVVFSGAFFGALKNGGINMERLTDVPSAVTEIVMSIIIITISARIVLPKLKKRARSDQGKG
ncbi:MAG: ABC transporter permease [Synergistaceae bacterium]|jgi:simple sugar transport system permease protein|nr:ABC transporter permease [Synergistaceae bacterium]